MTTLFTSGLSQVSDGLEHLHSLNKTFGSFELGLIWGNTFFPSTNSWKSAIQWIRSYSEPLVIASCARSGFKWISHLKTALCSSKTSLKDNIMKYVSTSAGLLEKVMKVGNWLGRKKFIKLCEHTMPELALGATVADIMSNSLDLSLLGQETDKSWGEITQKSLDVIAALLVLAVMAETGLPVQEVILLCKTVSTGISLSGICAKIHTYFEGPKELVEEGPELV